MEGTQLTAEWRLYAVEWAVSRIWSVLLEASGHGSELMAEIRQQTIESARAKAFPGLDAAMSDLMSAEMEAAIDRILRMVEAHMDSSLRTGSLKQFGLHRSPLDAKTQTAVA